MTSAETDDISRIATDPDVFEAFYRRHIEGVQRFVARRVDDPHMAADLVADIFLGAIDGAHGYRPDRGNEGGWLFGVARNVVAAEFRRQDKERRLVRRVAGRRHLDADALSRMEDRIDAERESRRLYAALGQLPRASRALMELVAVDGMTVAEAAAVLGLKPGAARVRLHRSRRLVQSFLQLAQATAMTQEVHP